MMTQLISTINILVKLLFTMPIITCCISSYVLFDTMYESDNAKSFYYDVAKDNSIYAINQVSTFSVDSLLKDEIEHNNQNTKTKNSFYNTKNFVKTDEGGIIFKSDIEIGEIGIIAENNYDDIIDNYFIIDIPNGVINDYNYYLEYDIKGINNLFGVPRSINDQFTIGGEIVEFSNGTWKEFKEKLDLKDLREGKNVIKFSKLNDHTYKVKNVRITQKNEEKSRYIVTFSEPKITSINGDKVIIRGYFGEGVK